MISQKLIWAFGILMVYPRIICAQYGGYDQRYREDDDSMLSNKISIGKWIFKNSITLRTVWSRGEWHVL